MRRIVPSVKETKHKIVGDASTANFAYTVRPLSFELTRAPWAMCWTEPSYALDFYLQWAASGRTNHPWTEAFLDCYKNHCKDERGCIAKECYARAKAVYPPLSGAYPNAHPHPHPPSHSLPAPGSAEEIVDSPPSALVPAQSRRRG